MSDPSENFFWFAALLLFAAVFVLGSLVARHPPRGIDVRAIVLRGQSLSAARFFTLLGRWPLLLGISIAVAVGALALRANVLTVGALFAVQGVAQAAASGIKLVFTRRRPDYWLAVHEPDHSYPSGHSVTSIVFYAGLALLAARSAVLPRPFAAIAVSFLVFCVFAIPWSRLSLGAHYPSDVVGGILFGCAWLCIAAAIVHHYGLMSASRIHG